MPKIIPTIEKAYVHYSGDPSVGIFAYGYEIGLHLNTQDLDEINGARIDILDLYEKIEGERPDSCRFDFEIKEENEQEAEMDRQREQFEKESEEIRQGEIRRELEQQCGLNGSMREWEDDGGRI